MSIRTRLALIYTGLLAAALVAFGSGVYLALRAELEQSFDASLIANAHHAADALAQDVDAREARRDGRTIELTTTEFNLLLLFMRHPRKVLTRDVIMEHVWAYDFEGESNVLEVYVRYLRNKLEASGDPRLLHTVRGAGYVLKE